MTANDTQNQFQTTPQSSSLPTHRQKRKNNSLTLGLVLIGMGIFFLLHKLNYIDARDFHEYWPLVICAFGAFDLLQARNFNDFGHALLVIGVGVWLQACVLDLMGLTFANSWPVFIIGAGISYVIKHFGQQHN